MLNIYIYVYAYIERGRERERVRQRKVRKRARQGDRERERNSERHITSIYTCSPYIYIYDAASTRSRVNVYQSFQCVPEYEVLVSTISNLAS